MDPEQEKYVAYYMQIYHPDEVVADDASTVYGDDCDRHAVESDESVISDFDSEEEAPADIFEFLRREVYPPLMHAYQDFLIRSGIERAIIEHLPKSNFESRRPHMPPKHMHMHLH